MRIFNLDIKRLVVLLLPVGLRNDLMKAYLKAAATPLMYVLDIFTRNRNDNLYRLSITPQVCFLEKMLNDRYDNTLRRIFITDGILRSQQYIYTEAEQRTKYIYTSGEANILYIFTSNEVGYIGGSFIVNVPSDISFNMDEMRALIDIYKLAGRTFEIKIY